MTRQFHHLACAGRLVRDNHGSRLERGSYCRTEKHERSPRLRPAMLGSMKARPRVARRSLGRYNGVTSCILNILLRKTVIDVDGKSDDDEDEGASAASAASAPQSPLFD